MRKTIPYSHQLITEDDINAVVKTLKSDFITQGPRVGEFEGALARYVEAKYAIAVTNGTSALHAACLAIGIQPGDEVIVPTLSFAASANCVLYCKGTPVLVDIDEDTLTINVEEAEKRITKKTKAIIAVDFAGHPADWKKLKLLAKKYDIFLISDASHALGSKYRNKPIGSIADCTIFSFHPVKTITTGEGGAITTNNKNLYKKLKQICNHGIVRNEKLVRRIGGWFYDIDSLGYNFRFTDIQASLGLAQLNKIDKFIQKRRDLWRAYKQALKGINWIKLPSEKKGYYSAWHLYPIRINRKLLGMNRKTLYEKLKKRGIVTQVHYKPIHLHSYYKRYFGYKSGDFPVAEKYASECLSLPLFPALTRKNHEYIIKILKNIKGDII